MSRRTTVLAAGGFAASVAFTLAGFALVIGDTMWIPSLLTLTFVFLLFPGGDPPSRRWRPIAWLSGVAIALSLPATLRTPGPLYYAPERDNPLGMTQARDVPGGLQGAAFVAMLGTISGRLSIRERTRPERVVA